MNILDPIERIEVRQELLMDRFVDDYTCMQCGKKYDYEMYCMNPIDGPLVCVECLGFDPMEKIYE